MSLIDITFSNKETLGDVDGQYQFHLDDTINGLMQYVRFKLADGKPVILYYNNEPLIGANDKTLKDIGILTGDNIEYKISEERGGRRKRKRKTKKRKIVKKRRTKRYYTF